jgi:histidinol-phosphate aminotransferase
MAQNRRAWIRQAAFSLSAFGLAPELLAGIPSEKAPGALILMNSNENPYGPSPMARKAMAEALARSNRYPDNEIPGLKKELADFWKAGPENVLMGAGASELIALTCMHAASTGKGHVITAETCYKVWNDQAVAAGLSIRPIANDPSKDIDLKAMLAAINTDTRLVYVCNPNNPTGKVLGLEPLRNFVAEASKKTMVILDEAYTEYAGFPTLAGEATPNKNLVVLKTFSKVYGLAGARIGYAIAHPDMINRLGSLQAWPDVSISQVTAAAASASLKDNAFVTDCKKKNALARDKCYSTFGALGLDYIPSETNFILFNIDRIKADLPREMEVHGIGVQYRNHFGGKWCRVSMGTLEETDRFCTALHAIMKT